MPFFRPCADNCIHQNRYGQLHMSSFIDSFVIGFQFYDLVSVTRAMPGGGKDDKMTTIRKRSGSQKIPSGITMTGFIRAAKLQASS